MRGFRALGPALVIVAAASAAGFGLTTLRDWHRHGAAGAGFLHLHPHVGGHDHRDHHDTDDPEENSPDRLSTCTVADASSTPAPGAHDTPAPTSTLRSVDIRRSSVRGSAAWHDTVNPRASPA